MTSRVVITGMGGVSSIGMSVPEIYNSMKEGVSGIGVLDIPDLARLKVKTGGRSKTLMLTTLNKKKCADGSIFAICLLAANEAIMSQG